MIMIVLLMIVVAITPITPSDVSCGHHRAPHCGGCPRGHGESYCNGECKWCKGKCQLKDEACRTDVSCGHHRAPNCGGCPRGHGESYCNGECKWCNGKCQLKDAACAKGVSCGHHRAGNCAGCPRGHGESYCNGECKWCSGKCQSKDHACTTEVSCGHHKAANCEGCPRGHGASYCNGECTWCNGMCQSKDSFCAKDQCLYEGNVYTKGQHFISKDCEASCTCSGPDEVECVPLCVETQLQCNLDSEISQKRVLRAPGCYCEVPICKVNGNWGEWSNGECSLTCGNGVQKRKRSCDNPAPSEGGLPCPGSSDGSQTCNEGECPGNGNWGEWSNGECSLTCGGGVQKRRRSCDNPAPANGGLPCPGSRDGSQTCNEEKCPAQAGSKDHPGGSCNALKGGNNDLKSGKYWVNLGKPTEVVCDMETGGGGWLMVGQAAIEDESQKEEIPYYKLLSNDLSKLGEVTKKRFLLGTDGLRELQGYTSFTQIRFFCHKPWHGRTVDIATKPEGEGQRALLMMLEKYNGLVRSCHSYDRLPDDNSIIGQHCEQWYDEYWNDQGRRSDGAKLYDYPFYINEYTTSLFGLWDSYRLECDDIRDQPGYSNVGRWAFYVR